MIVLNKQPDLQNVQKYLKRITVYYIFCRMWYNNNYLDISSNIRLMFHNHVIKLIRYNRLRYYQASTDINRYYNTS